MKKFLQQDIENIFAKKQVWLTFLFLGILFRAINALYNYAPVAIDDYANLLAPALKKIQTGVPIEVENYRMVFLGQLVYAVVLPLHKMGVENPRFLISGFYFVISMFSLFFVWGGYKLTLNFSVNKNDNEKSNETNGLAFFVLSVFAVQFIMPFISSKAYIESLAMFFIPWAFYFFTKPHATAKDYFGGSFWLSFSVLFRFQNGILIIVTGFYILYEIFSKQKNWKHLFAFLLAGFLVLAFMGTLDVISGRTAFSTIINYVVLNFNTNVTTQIWGTSPWYTYIIILLLVFIPPISFFLLPSLWQGMKRSPLLAINVFVFVLFHSFIPNKLERFLFPILPLFIILTIIGLPVLRGKSKSITQKAFHWFFIVNFPLVLLVTFSRSQMNIVKAASYMYEHPTNLYYFYGSLNFWVQGYYGYQYPSLHTIDEKAFMEHLKQDKKIYVLSYDKLENFSKEKSQNNGSMFTCKTVEEFHPDFAEKLVILTNPEFNKRRDTIYLEQCALQK